MIRPSIRNAIVVILICVICFVVWLLLRSSGDEPAVAEIDRADSGLKETEAIPPAPEWDREAETNSSDPDNRSRDDEEFLATDYEPLDKWLNERFEIDYKQMTPTLIFDQVPLNDIFYETLALPDKPPAFRLQSSDISRRELLKKIADFWQLDMSIITDDSGNPTAVRVLSPGFYR